MNLCYYRYILAVRKGEQAYERDNTTAGERAGD
jgi:hypothetical protein